MKNQHVQLLRQQLLNLFAAGLRCVNARAVLAKHLEQELLLATHYGLVAIGTTAHCHIRTQQPNSIHGLQAGEAFCIFCVKHRPMLPCSY